MCMCVLYIVVTTIYAYRILSRIIFKQFEQYCGKRSKYCRNIVYFNKTKISREFNKSSTKNYYDLQHVSNKYKFLKSV